MKIFNVFRKKKKIVVRVQVDKILVPGRYPAEVTHYTDTEHHIVLLVKIK